MLVPGLVQAQAIVRVTGVAFDSLSARPLSSAFVTLGSKSAMSDSLGRFAFDSVATGTYRVTMQHDVLDSLGLPGITSSVVVRDSMDPIRIATPSIRTMWRRVCPGEAPPDSGFVFGTVRDAATRTPVRRGQILGTWIDLAGSGASRITQKQWRLESETVDDGSFVLCGLPLNSGIRLMAGHDSAGAVLDLVLSRAAPVRRQDLALSDPRNAARGVVRGIVTSGGQTVSNARINVGGASEVRSGGNGRFIVRNVPVGTQQLEVEGIGFSPVTRIVEVSANDTVEVSVNVERITMLDSVTVSASAARVRLANQYDQRRRMGNGYYRDSTEIGRFNTLDGVFNGMGMVSLRRPRGATPTISIGSRCPSATIYIDRTRTDADHLMALRPSDIAAMEVYRPGELPIDLAAVLGLHPMAKPCAVVVWTKLGWR